ncbi:his Kinase A (Phosphoacceptor) domain./Histidine kinase-DNA gyrase B-and HSP90-like ATPase [Clostridium sp. CAG:349]|nr:his Kinase A (Phosphoacceptor) domain./Histidine kinase-DNA gyrase B-and HSP90-like ATPase [Clostridium sp. CAG:349]
MNDQKIIELFWERHESAIYDDGDGIDKDDLPHVFERFYTGKKGNTGIGLALTKEIIKMHGGEIRARNKTGRLSK